MSSAPEESYTMEPTNSSVEENADLKFFNDLCRESEFFHNHMTEFRTESNRIHVIAGDDREKKIEIAKHAKDTRVILHSSLKKLIEDFLHHKINYGTTKEKELYKDIANANTFVIRALRNRPFVFFGSNDVTVLRDNSQPSHKDWITVGTDDEGSIKITDYMTYDEIAISALIGVSVPTFFINSGGRYNVGNCADPKQDFGIYVALTGARFEKRDKMESKHMLVTPQFHTDNLGYGKIALLDSDSNESNESNPEVTKEAQERKAAAKLLQVWAEFYGELNKTENGTRHFFLSFDEVDALYNANDPDITKRFYKPPHAPSLYINLEIYKKRIRYIVEPFLYEANERAHQYGKKAYIHAVGLGLGVWQISNEQAFWMMDVYAEIITNDDFSHIGDIDFSWFPENSKCGGVEDGGYIRDKNENRICIHFSKRDPAQKLDSDENLLVAMYAWDGNSFPGNEYWRGMLHASGDPAAACCSTIAELQNPYINVGFMENQRYYPKHFEK